MNKFDWSRVIVGSLIGVILPACSAAPGAEPAAALNPADPSARAFNGTIVSFRPNTSTMLISKDEYHGRDNYPNIIQVKYTADTISLDHRATLDQIQQYMPVTIAGHMHDGHLIVETANFSSILPANVKPAPTANARTTGAPSQRGDT